MIKEQLEQIKDPVVTARRALVRLAPAIIPQVSSNLIESPEHLVAIATRYRELFGFTNYEIEIHSPLIPRRRIAVDVASGKIKLDSELIGKREKLVEQLLEDRLKPAMKRITYGERYARRNLTDRRYQDFKRLEEERKS